MKLNNPVDIARIVLRLHGTRASVVARKQADRLWDSGDYKGAELWKQIDQRIDQIRHTSSFRAS